MDQTGSPTPSLTGRLKTLVALDVALSRATSREELLTEVKARVPELLPGLRLALNVQIEDPSLIEAVILSGQITDEPESYTRPSAGSALARARDIGAHRTDLRTSRSYEHKELAAEGYTDRAAFPITFGPSVVGSLAISAGHELRDEEVDTARLVCAVLSSRSYWFGIPGSADSRSLVTQVALLRQAAHTLERTDPLTRLPNRVAVFEGIARARSLAEAGAPSSFAFIDLDHYKIVNDALGHAVGDEALVAFAERLRKAAARASIAFGRVGGDEFSAVAETSPEELRAILEEVATDLADHPLVIGGQEVHAAFSAGVYPIDGHQHGIEEIVSRAEGAAYQAKRDGRGRVIVRLPGDPGHTASHLEMRQVEVVRSAVRAGRLQMVAQPIRAVRAGERPPMDAEALVRLHDEQGHTLLPDDFVSLAEQYDVVNALDRAVLAQVVRLLVETDEPARVSCNVSPHSLLDPAFVEWAATLIEDAGIGADLVLELTERLPIGRTHDVRASMLRLRRTGIRFAIDDFGAGTTSYGNLRELPVDVLKVDGALIRGALEGKVDRAMLRATIEVANALGVTTVAEGVETSEQYSAVAALGVDAVQGYYFGLPAPWETVEESLRTGQTDVDTPATPAG